MAGTVHYVLVNSATEGMELYRHLKACGARARIAPVPRGLTACCGTSLLVEPDDIDAVRSALAVEGAPTYDRIVELENRIDPHRDRYC